jgi:hypothetical protein
MVEIKMIKMVTVKGPMEMAKSQKRSKLTSKLKLKSLPMKLQ